MVHPKSEIYTQAMAIATTKTLIDRAIFGAELYDRVQFGIFFIVVQFIFSSSS